MRALAWAGITLGALTALTGVVHVPAVQRVMGWRNAEGDVICPVGFSSPRASLASTIARAARVATPSTLPVPAGRPALGFELDVTTRHELARWAVANGVVCSARDGGTRLECPRVPASALGDTGPDATTAWFELDGAGRLRAIKTARRTAAAAPIADAFRATRAELDAGTGRATVATGDAATLTRGAFQQASVEYRYRGYRALVRATNMGDGYLLTESYGATPL